MKPSHSKCIYPGLLAGLICCSVFFSSCDTYNFLRPLPSDRQNLYEFPEIFRGNWIIKNNEGSVLIGKQYLRYIHNHYQEKIVMGAYPRIDSNGYFNSAPFARKSLLEIRYDSLRRPVDTVPNYVLSKGFIYAIDYDSLLVTGNPYYVDGDTMIVSTVDTIWLDLGQNAFLRKLNDELYVLNIRNRVLGREDAWWQLSILEKRINGNIRMLTPARNFDRLPGLLYSSNSNLYYDSKWTAAEMELLVKQGYFITGTILLEDSLRRNTR